MSMSKRLISLHIYFHSVDDEEDRRSATAAASTVMMRDRDTDSAVDPALLTASCTMNLHVPTEGSVVVMEAAPWKEQAVEA